MDITEIITTLRKKYEQSYGFAVFDLETEEKEDALLIRGRVLTGNQKAEVLAQIGKDYPKKIEEEITVLSDPASAEMGWALVTAPLADQRSRFVSSALLNDKIRKRLRASQLRQGDIVRILYAKEDQLLGQSGDLALGWTDCKDVEMHDGSLREKWLGGSAAKPGELVPVSGRPQDLIREAESYLGVRYVLGGKSADGIDCSALMQSVYKAAWDIILPRHSWDQKGMGVEVERGDVRTGDLVFMTHKEKHTRHVGMWEEAQDSANILHASFSAGGVVRQRTEEVFAVYRLEEIRRIAQIAS